MESIRKQCWAFPVRSNANFKWRISTDQVVSQSCKLPRTLPYGHVEGFPNQENEPPEWIMEGCLPDDMHAETMVSKWLTETVREDRTKTAVSPLDQHISSRWNGMSSYMMWWDWLKMKRLLCLLRTWKRKEEDIWVQAQFGERMNFCLH